MSPEILKLIEENEEIVEKNLYRWITGFKKKKTVFSIPTDSEIIKYYNECGYCVNNSTISRIRACYEGKKEGKWVDSNGREVMNWKGKIRTVWFKDAVPLPKQIKIDKF